MPNTLDYLAWRGDLTLTERPFNRVDNLILSHLAYLDLESIVPPPGVGEAVSLSQVALAYDAAGIDQSRVYQDPGPLLRAAAKTRRFAEIKLAAFVNEVDNEKQVQFAALTYVLPDGTDFVAYRGTDNTIVGWREDFNTSYLPQTPGQQSAVDYLLGVAAATDRPLLVGGHSKGGNLAMYAASFCGPEVQARIRRVYSNDGPGFHPSLVDRPGYLAVLDRAELILPESSIVGILLGTRQEPRVIRSSAAGPMQHNPYSWQVLGADFVPGESLSGFSQFLDATLDRWNETLTDDQRRTVITAIFDALDASGVSTMGEIKAKKWVCLNAILKAARAMEPEIQHQILDSLRKLAGAGKDVLWNDAKKAFETRDLPET